MGLIEKQAERVKERLERGARAVRNYEVDVYLGDGDWRQIWVSDVPNIHGVYSFGENIEVREDVAADYGVPVEHVSIASVEEVSF